MNRKTKSIRYNANGGRGVPANHTVQIDANGGAVFNLSTVRLTKSGYTFLGWRLDNSPTFGIDSPGQQIAIGLTPGSTLTYFAQWQREQQRTIRVPNVVGQSRASAEGTLWHEGFYWITVEEFHPTVAAGNVISQSLRAGTTQPLGTTITITVSRGQQRTIRVPNVVGQSRASAEGTLWYEGFYWITVEEFHPTVAAGNVISQSLRAGTTQPLGTIITITVSRGR